MYNDNVSVMCTQDVVEAVQTARFVTAWLQRNASLFHDTFDTPAVADMSDELAQQWAARAVDSEATYEQLRDSTLFNFRRQDDLVLFMKLLNTGLNVPANVCLAGDSYIANNASYP